MTVNQDPCRRSGWDWGLRRNRCLGRSGKRAPFGADMLFPRTKMSALPVGRPSAAAWGLDAVVLRVDRPPASAPIRVEGTIETLLVNGLVTRGFVVKTDDDTSYTVTADSQTRILDQSDRFVPTAGLTLSLQA